MNASVPIEANGIIPVAQSDVAAIPRKLGHAHLLMQKALTKYSNRIGDP